MSPPWTVEPMRSQYSLTPTPDVQTKVTVSPGRVDPGGGEVMTPGAYRGPFWDAPNKSPTEPIGGVPPDELGFTCAPGAPVLGAARAARETAARKSMRRREGCMRPHCGRALTGRPEACSRTRLWARPPPRRPGCEDLPGPGPAA